MKEKTLTTSVVPDDIVNASVYNPTSSLKECIIRWPVSSDFSFTTYYKVNIMCLFLLFVDTYLVFCLKFKNTICKFRKYAFLFKYIYFSLLKLLS